MSSQKKERYFRVYIMPIDYALILSAGLGTRMGQIGKQLPKVLWPIYFKNMLELQISYCQNLGIKKIYINSHFLHHEIIGFLESASLLDTVTVLHEKILLDSGGAIHNFAALEEVNYRGKLLIVNGDQFLFFKKKKWEDAVLRLAECRAVLFGINVAKNSSYNETIVIKNRLVEIKKNNEAKFDYMTYSGLGLLNLEGLKPISGISKFFETVADYKNQNVEMFPLSDFEYWDFGSADIYARNIFLLKNQKEAQSKMHQFLEEQLCFIANEKLFVTTKSNSIDMDFSGTFQPDSLHFKGVFQKI